MYPGETRLLMAEFQGQYRIAPGQRWAIVVSRFNQRITDRLLEGAISTLIRHGASADAIDTFWVPGAFEIPGLTHQLASQSYTAIITLGAVVRGDTPHFDYVAGNTASALAHLTVEHEIPIIFGILTTDTMDQAEDRAGGKAGNKGAEAAQTAIEMADLYRRVSKHSTKT